MKRLLVRLGNTLLVFALLTSAVEMASGRGLSGWVAQWRCGANYLVEIDGVLSERSCGFDADMMLVALVFLALVSGLFLVGTARYMGRR